MESFNESSKKYSNVLLYKDPWAENSGGYRILYGGYGLRGDLRFEESGEVSKK